MLSKCQAIQSWQQSCTCWRWGLAEASDDFGFAHSNILGSWHLSPDDSVFEAQVLFTSDTLSPSGLYLGVGQRRHTDSSSWYNLTWPTYFSGQERGGWMVQKSSNKKAAPELFLDSTYCPIHDRWPRNAVAEAVLWEKADSEILRSSGILTKSSTAFHWLKFKFWKLRTYFSCQINPPLHLPTACPSINSPMASILPCPRNKTEAHAWQPAHTVPSIPAGEHVAAKESAGE